MRHFLWSALFLAASVVACAKPQQGEPSVTQDDGGGLPLGDAESGPDADALGTDALPEPPLAVFTGPGEATALEPVSYDASGSLDPDGTLAELAWDFDYDGVAFDVDATGVAVTHAFPKAGTYQIALRATDDAGAQTLFASPVLVKSQAEAYPVVVAVIAGPASLVEGDSASFDGTGSSAQKGALSAYAWDFDYQPESFEASADTAIASHIFTTPGAFVVALRVWVTYDDQSSAWAETTREVAVQPDAAPLASFTAPEKAKLGVPVLFDGAASLDPDGTVVEHAWDFAYAGATFDAEALGVQATRAFDEAGTHLVALRVTDAKGKQGIAARALEIVPNQLPLAVANAPATAVAGVPVVFDGSASVDPDGTLTAWEWDFEYAGELEPDAAGQMATHIFEQGGVTAVVALRVTDDEGAQDLALWPIQVAAQGDAYPAPKVSFTAPTTVGIGDAAVFDATESSTSEGAITAYAWDPDYDGLAFSGVSGGSVWTWSWSKAATYVVALRITVEHADGSTVTALATRVVEVEPNLAPIAAIAGPAQGVVGETLSFDGTGSYDPDGILVTWEWDVDYSGLPTAFAADASGQLLTHKFSAAGTKHLALRVTDEQGAQGLKEVVIQVVLNAPPIAAFDAPTTAICGIPVAFDASSSLDPDGQLVSWEWDFAKADAFKAKATGVKASHAYALADAGLRTVMLCVKDQKGASACSSRPILVASQAESAAPLLVKVAGPSTVAVGEDTLFNGGSSVSDGGTLTAFEWDFAYTGSFQPDATGSVVTHAWEKAGTYLLALRVTASFADGSAQQAVGTATLVVTQNQAPTAVISAPAKAALGQVVGLTASGSFDPDGTIAAYAWDLEYQGTFAEPPDATGVETSAKLSKVGTFAVALRVTDDDGAQALVTHYIEVAPLQPPVALIAGPAEGTLGHPVNLSATASSDPDGAIVAYAWDFDYAGATFTEDASDPITSHVYPSAGAYVVALRVTDDAGQTDLATHFLTVTQNLPPVALIAGPPKATVGAPVGLSASGSYDPDGLVLELAWDLDYDGTFAEPPSALGLEATAKFTTPGAKTVALRVTDDDGAPTLATHFIDVQLDQPPVAVVSGPAQATVGDPVSFSAAGSTDPDGAITGYAWDFDYGAPSFEPQAEGAIASHTFGSPGTYVVALRVTGTGGAQAVATHFITLVANQPPVAVIAGPASEMVGEAVGLSALGSYDPDGKIAEIAWDFAYDGSFADPPSATGPEVTIVFAEAGPATVAVRVTDDDGAQAVALHAVAIQADPAPVASIDGPAKAVVGKKVAFSGAASHDPQGSIVAYAWDFDFGSQGFVEDAQGVVAAYVFGAPGTYVVALQVTDDGGSVGLATWFVEVTANQPPVAAIAAPSTVTAGKAFGVSGGGSYDPDGSIADFAWDLAFDGSFAVPPSASGPEATATFFEPGGAALALRVTDAEGASQTATWFLEVVENQPPSADISGPTGALVGETVSFSALGSSDPDGYLADYAWDFESDGVLDKHGATVTRSWATPGVYVVTLRTTDNEGATQDGSHEIAVTELATAALTSVSPAVGSRLGGTVVTLVGKGFTGANDTQVWFRGAPALVLGVQTSTQMTVSTPPGDPGPAEIELHNFNGVAFLEEGSPAGFAYGGATNRATTDFDWQDPSGGADLGFAPGDDDATEVAPLPFDFGFFGVLMPAGTPIFVSSNGWASFSDLSAADDFALPSPSEPGTLLAPFFFDQVAGAGAMVRATVSGAAPDRRFTVTWEGFTREPALSDLYVYQLTLYEGSHDLEMRYLNPRDPPNLDDNVLDDSQSGAQATIGIQDADGTAGAQFSRDAFVAGASPGGLSVVFAESEGVYEIASANTMTLIGTSLPPDGKLGTDGHFTLTFTHPVKLASAIASDPPLASDTLRVEDPADGALVPIAVEAGANAGALEVTVLGALTPYVTYEVVAAPGLQDSLGESFSWDPRAAGTEYRSPFQPCQGAECLYTFSGVRTDVPVAALTGWTLCHQDTYAGSKSLATILAACNLAKLLVACRPTGSATLTVLAQAPRADVLFDTGAGNTPHVANGVGWYYNSDWSWGFAPEGVPVKRWSCDVEASPLNGNAGVEGPRRLCWHTDSGSLTTGWRCGAKTYLNYDGSYERLVYEAP